MNYLLCSILKTNTKPNPSTNDYICLFPLLGQEQCHLSLLSEGKPETLVKTPSCMGSNWLDSNPQPLHRSLTARLPDTLFIHVQLFYPFVHAVRICTKVLPNPVNGNVETFMEPPSWQANYQCDAGYALKGTVLRSCDNEGVWAGDAPTCEGTNHCL